MRMGWIVGAVALAWFTLGSPMSDIAGWVWGNSPAPWETVDAFYYPNRNNLSHDERRLNVGSVDACRAWVAGAAARRDDPQIRRGDYECGVGHLKDYGELKVYRVTTR
jgi:hypothetical protein